MGFSKKAERIVALANDIAKSANELMDSEWQDNARLRSFGEMGAEISAATLNALATKKKYLTAAQKIYQLRRRRDAVFGDSDLFGDPAWDMMIDLYGASIKGKRISVTSACIASCAPPTTALRWIAVLESAGLLIREKDDHDGRRMFVQLTSKAIGALETVFSEWP